MDPELFRRLEPLLVVWVAALGACVGSFLNVCVYRLPRRCLSVLRPARSFCPGCRRQLTWSENIPLLSWLVQGARCRGCKGTIPVRYPAVELATLVLFALLAWRDLVGHMDDPARWGLFAIHAALASAVLVCVLTDFEFRIIPDEIDVPGMFLAPLCCLLVPAALTWNDLPAPTVAAGALHGTLESAFRWWGLDALLAPLGWLAQAPRDGHASALVGSLLGVIFGAGVIWAIGVVGTVAAGRDTMGFGDVKFMGMLGGFAGVKGVALSFPVAFISGSLGGLLHMVLSGRPYIVVRDLSDESMTPIRRWALAATGARAPAPGPDGQPAAPDARLPIRPGTSLLARLATGDPYIPFGPFLALGAMVVIFFPEAVPALLRKLF